MDKNRLAVHKLNTRQISEEIAYMVTTVFDPSEHERELDKIVKESKKLISKIVKFKNQQS
jgi:hypothetical protein